MSASSVAVPTYPAAAMPRVINPWIVALAVVIPTFMEVLDTTVANVALRYIAGGLSAAVIDSEWVITSYLVANAIILPISGWLSIRLGRRNYFLLSILVFTVASALCAMATSLGMLIFSRVLQGLAGGGLQPSSQGVLLDAFPKEKQGAAQTAFAIATLLAPVVGPTLGGYITDNFGWRWCFYINLPVGILALIMAKAVVFDPDYLKAQTAEARKEHRTFDTPGLCLLAITMSSWEVLLTKGQEWDWFGDPFLRVQTLALLFVLGLGGLIFRELRFANPLVNFRTLKDPNFRACCVIIFCAFATLYANTVSLPALLQSLFGYDATTSGLVLSPSGIFAIVMLAIVGRLLGRGVDARYLMATGLFIMALASYWISRLNLEISPWHIVWPRVVFVIGVSTIFAPLNVAAFLNIPPQLRGAAVGLLALLRNEGGSVGTSVAQTIQERRDQFHSLRLGENLDQLNPAVNSYFNQVQPGLLQQNGDPVATKQMALQILDNLRAAQSSALAYFDTFFVFAVVALALVGLVLLMKRSVAAKGAHVATE
jgi:MFS transporter, DHA2 family, multidrug resistance protein